MSDLIKRSDAIRALHKHFASGFDCDRWWNSTTVLSALNSVSSAGRPQGKWKNYKDEHYCTNCGEVVIGDWYTEDEWYDFCPNCGARMKGADDE